ncbi:MAG: leucine-rich repeat protein [Eubacterium sp.]|nr:leucine-rich repeat protein [Eubacterium sp.]
MKKLMKCIMVTLCLAVAVAFAAGVQSTNVQAKKKVTYKLKKGTLTIKGKGNMPKKIKVKKSKVKKIVIKKGVKNISNNAFKNFKKVTKVTIAKTVKSIGVSAFEGTAIKKLTIPTKATKLGKGFINKCKKLDFVTLPGNFIIVDKNGKALSNRGNTSGTNLDTVTFNTSLDYNVAAYFRTYNFETAASDPNFKSFDGVLYTKDGSGIVRVPSGRDTIALREGCTVFNVYSVTYSSGAGYVCNNLVRVTLPSSLVKVNDEAYPDVTNQVGNRSLDIIADKTNIEIPQIVILKKVFDMDAATLKKKFPTRITEDDGFTIGDGKYVIIGNGAEPSVVPVGITTICDYAYDSVAVNKVALPTSVETIGKSAFAYTALNEINLENVKSIGKSAFCGTALAKVELPAAITTILDKTFYDCTDLSEVKVNGELKSIGAKAFMNTRINLGDFLAANTKLETVGKEAFSGVAWTNITIPANIKTVGAKAFAESSNTKFVLIKGSTAGFDMKAFGVRNNVTYQFEQGVTQAWVTPDIDSYTTKKALKISLGWDKVSEINGYEIWVAKDKALKKGVKKYTAKYNEKSKNISITKKKAKGLKYVGIRAYKTVDGKKVYSKWNINTL